MRKGVTLFWTWTMFDWIATAMGRKRTVLQQGQFSGQPVFLVKGALWHDAEKAGTAARVLENMFVFKNPPVAASGGCHTRLALAGQLLDRGE